MEIIVTHTNADFDAFAAMVGAKKLHPLAQIVMSGGQDRNVREFITLHRDLLDISSPKEIDLSRVDSVVVVDTSMSRRLGEVQQALQNPGVKITVYDHHPAGVRDIRADTRVFRERGAVTTILVEEIRKRQLPVTPFEATLLALGIYEDTGSLTFSSTTPADLEAVAWLLSRGANLDVVASFITPALTEGQRKLLNDLILSAEYHTVHGARLAVATAEGDAYIGELALLATKLLDIENVDAVFTLARLQDVIFVVGRSRSRTVDIGKVVVEFGGGGHSRAASATVKSSDLAACKEKLLALLPEKIKSEITARSIMSAPARTVRADATLEEAAEMMTRFGHSGLSVVQDEKLVGIISRRDLDKARHHRLLHAPVKGFMSRDLVTVEPDTPLSEIERLMIDNDVGRLPVIEAGALIGIVTRSDILRAVHGQRYAGARRISRSGHVADQLRERLPEPIFDLLRKIGDVAADKSTPVFVVGGFVRDMLLGVPTLDVDVLVEGEGIQFAKVLAKKLGGTAKTHPRFGTAVVWLPDDFKVDIASARREVYEHPAALPDVEHSSVREDLQRRDFGINAMAVQLDGENFGKLLDYYGGRRDLKNGVIRILHNLSFVEDPTRIFRALRFEARLGFRMDRHTEELALHAVEEGVLDRLSGERLRDELVLILSEPQAISTLERMELLGLLQQIHPDPRLDVGLARRVIETLEWFEGLETGESVERWMLLLASMMSHLKPPEVADICRQRLRITFPKAELIRACIESGQEISGFLAAEPSPKPSEIYWALIAAPIQALVFAGALGQSEAIRGRLELFMTKLRHTRLTIKGQELVKLGFRPGPNFGLALRETLNARLDGLVRGKQQELNYAEEKLKALEGLQ